jgi:hypothetical protein
MAYTSAGPTPAANWPATQGAEAYFSPRAQRQLGSALVFLPGSSRQQQIGFETQDGLAIYEGDIMLGPATALPFRYGMPRQSALDTKSAVALVDRSYLWPKAEIPYVVDASAGAKQALISWSVQQFDSTALRLRPRTAADRDYVVFRHLGEGCWSYLGRQGGAQDIDVSGCAGGSIVHELLHAAGFYHEQSRGDRDQHVSIMWDEISPEMRFNFEKRDARGQDIGPYDYGSIMHYPSHAGSRSGNPTIVPRIANVRIGQRDGLSPLDRSAIATLYPAANGVPAPSPVPSVARPSAPPATPAPSAAPAPAVVPSATPLPVNPALNGTFSSVRGNVSCTQGGVFAQCQYPGGTLFCAANGPELACTWSGGGQGRAAFQRQVNGVWAGSFGDAFSDSSRGRWDLVPLQTSAGAAPTVPSQPVPSQPAPVAAAPAAVPTPAAPPAANAASLSGNFSSSRGAMACVDSGSGVSCNFQEPDGVTGRLDCAKSQSALELSCAWITFLPRPGTGRAVFSRRAPGERTLAGTWGHLLATTGGGRWDVQAR